MKKIIKLLFVFILIAIVIIVAVIFIDATRKIEAESSVNMPKINMPGSTEDSTPTEVEGESVSTDEIEQGLNIPVEGFKDRITLKPFGKWITPNDSPIQPERFVGYHAGVDVEFTDRSDEIPVYAIAPGIVVTSRTASGYGGVMIISHEIEDKNILTVYGHLDPAQLLSVDELVEAGQQIGILGEGETSETDGERKHLHLGMLKIGRAELVGYANTEDELNENWYNPIDFF